VIATSSNSNEIDGKATYLVPLQLVDDYIPDSGSRIVGKLYADVSGGGSAPTARVYYQGDTSSRWEIPANSEIFKNIFVPYDGAVQNVDLGSNDLTTTGTIEGGTLTEGGNAVYNSTEIDTETEFEAELFSVFTPNDGALEDDDLSDNDTDDLAEGATNKYATLANIQSACSNDFHNIGGPDDDVPEAEDFSNLTAGRSLTHSPTGTIGADEETYFYTWRYGAFDPVADDDISQVDYFKKAVTLTEFRCYSDQTVVVQLQRDDGSAADIFTANVTCDSDGGSACASSCDTTLVDAEDNCAATDKLDLVTVSVSGTPTIVTMQLFGTYDD